VCNVPCAANCLLWRALGCVRTATTTTPLLSALHTSTLRKAGFAVNVDDTDETLSKKIRAAQLLQTNYICVVGDREVANRTLAVRPRDPSQRICGDFEVPSFVEALQKSVAEFE
jgi:threonyl-tRNA synthetase